MFYNVKETVEEACTLIENFLDPDVYSKEELDKLKNAMTGARESLEKESLVILQGELKQLYEDLGPCDHPVNYCVCRIDTYQKQFSDIICLFNKNK